MAERIVLIGMMGAGKTTVGRILAGILGWRYIDSDAQVSGQAGRTVREIFENEGELAFRRLESAALRDAMSVDDDVVIGAAGGAVLDPANRELLASATKVVWLRAPVDVLSVRARSGDHRPLLADDPAKVIARLYEARQPLYEELADLTIDVDRSPPEEVARRIAEAVA